MPLTNIVATLSMGRFLPLMVNTISKSDVGSLDEADAALPENGAGVSGIIFLHDRTSRSSHASVLASSF
jgi:hypothetical protein